MLRDCCVERRGLAERVGAHGSGRERYEPQSTFRSVTVGCLPDRYGTPGGIRVGHIVTQ